ncbi:hypothetical protein RSOLAG22IIIB_06910 [Rhizoctonia solani]|uniref:Uncharacterized protein n=1 Tax=Rhizoctonia solani TaxID=456999 RepID=A0A0K6GHB2_9AGAM|nr:hypothetical protein RSOLAG22IIIB_06910 [Rhizoctonia solani]
MTDDRPVVPLLFLSTTSTVPPTAFSFPVVIASIDLESHSVEQRRTSELDDVESLSKDRTSGCLDLGEVAEMKPPRDSSPILFLSSDSIEPIEDRASTPSQRLSSPEIPDNDNDNDEYLLKSPSDDEIKPDITLESSRSPTPEPSDTRYSFRSRGQQTKRANPSPDLPTPSNTRRRRSPSPQARPSKRRRHSSPVSDNSTRSPPPHPYDTCPTSYKSGSGKRGGRGGRIRSSGRGKAEIRFTPMERLGDREAKYKHVRKHGHLFGDKHGCYFNPYSHSPIKKSTFKRIGKPLGVVICRTSKPVHELMGLRDDYEFRLEIGETVRHAAALFLPRNTVLKSGELLSYVKHYNLAARVRIYRYVYNRFPFLYHFRTESDKGNWVIDGICTSSIFSRNVYLKTKKLPTNFDLKQHTSNSIHNDEDQDELDELEIPSGYEDDYALYASAGASRSTTTHKRRRPSDIDPEASDDYDSDLRSPKKRRSSSEEQFPGPSTLRPKPTAEEDRDNQGAARRRAYRKVFGTPANKTTRTTVAGSMGGKDGRKRARTASTPSDVKTEDDSKDEPVQHENRILSTPDIKPVLHREEIIQTTPEDIGTNRQNHKGPDPASLEEAAPQSSSSTLRSWLSSITFGFWKW